MDLASIDLIEQRHHDKRVENNCEVLGGRRVHRPLAATVDVEYQVTCTGTITITVYNQHQAQLSLSSLRGK